jgi:ribonuclease HII
VAVVVAEEEVVAVPALVSAPVAGVAVVAEEVAVVAPASVNMLGHRKAKRLRKNQRESLYPHLAGDRYCGLSIPTHSHLRCRKRLRQ